MKVKLNNVTYVDSPKDKNGSVTICYKDSSYITYESSDSDEIWINPEHIASVSMKNLTPYSDIYGTELTALCDVIDSMFRFYGHMYKGKKITKILVPDIYYGLLLKSPDTKYQSMNSKTTYYTYLNVPIERSESDSIVLEHEK